jgi:hypothetical protein
MRAACRTIEDWDQNPPERTNLRWSPTAARAEIGESEPFVAPVVGKALTTLLSEIGRPLHFEHPAWDPTTEDRQAYIEKASQRFRDELAQYLERVENRLNMSARRKAPQVKKEHFEWLVLYQIRGMSRSAIAGSEAQEGQLDGNYYTVSQAIDRTTKLLFGECWREWLRTRSKGGRPSKSTPGIPVTGDEDDGDEA